MAASDNGTELSVPLLQLSAGIRQTRFTRSIYCHRALMGSPKRQPVEWAWRQSKQTGKAVRHGHPTEAFPCVPCR